MKKRPPFRSGHSSMAPLIRFSRWRVLGNGGSQFFHKIGIGIGLPAMAFQGSAKLERSLKVGVLCIFQEVLHQVDRQVQEISISFADGDVKFPF